MKDEINSYFKSLCSIFCSAYAGFVYKSTYDISLVTIVLLVACLAPVLHLAWNYIRIRFGEYEEQHFHHYYRG